MVQLMELLYWKNQISMSVTMFVNLMFRMYKPFQC